MKMFNDWYRRFTGVLRLVWVFLSKSEDLTAEEVASLDKVRNEMTEAKTKVSAMDRELPVTNNGFYLNLILGSTLNLSLLSNDARYKYKEEYESFKWRVTCTMLVVISLCYLYPARAIDWVGNFIMVWYYCTLTIREAVLRINGSRIKGWWVAHHYLSCVLSGIMLTWQDGDCYRAFRTQFIFFIAYISLVQLLQNQYQSGCLRRLHSLGQGHKMDITLEGFTTWMFKGLTFLLPFLCLGYVFQLYNAYTLFFLAMECPGQWQIAVLCLLFAIIACGNIYTTSLVCLKKFQTSGSYNTILGITNKYRMRRTNSKST